MTISSMQQLTPQVIDRYRKVRNDLERIRVPMGSVSEVRLNPRLKSTKGRCVKKGNTFEIEINPSIIDDTKPNILDDVLAHELIHTVPYCQNHSARFKKWMMYVNSALPGYHIQVYFRYEDYGLENPREAMKTEDYPYLIECEQCHAQIGRLKKSNLVSHPQRYRCANCGGRLIRIR